MVLFAGKTNPALSLDLLLRSGMTVVKCFMAFVAQHDQIANWLITVNFGILSVMYVKAGFTVACLASMLCFA